MKDFTLPNRISALVTNLLDALGSPEQTPSKSQARKSPPKARRNRQARKDFFYYKPVIDQETKQVAGHLSDISLSGFKLDSQRPIPINKDFHFMVNLTSEIADKPSMMLVARSKWCKIDPIDPYVYNVGFQLILIAPEDLEIFHRMMEKYGREHTDRTIDLRRSNKW
jgi:hypothetical protein